MPIAKIAFFFDMTTFLSFLFDYSACRLKSLKGALTLTELNPYRSIGMFLTTDRILDILPCCLEVHLLQFCWKEVEVLGQCVVASDE